MVVVEMIVVLKSDLANNYNICVVMVERSGVV